MINDSIIDEKIKQINKIVEVELDADDSELSDQITCGDSWDDPATLGKAMDGQPHTYMRWAYLLKSLQVENEKIRSLLDVWVAEKKEEIRNQIYEENIKKGMTPNNSVPTSSAVENRFKTAYEEVDDDGEYIDDEYKHFDNKMLEIGDKVSKVGIVVKAFEQRHSMLISMSALLRSMMDNNLITKEKLESFEEEDDE
jgi:hypothetical protein